MNNLKFYRTKAGLTLQNVADVVKTSRQAICTYETDDSSEQHRKLSKKLAKDLSAYLGCNKFELLGDEGFSVPVENDEDRFVLIRKLFSEISDPEVKESLRNYVLEKKEENQEDGITE